MKDNKIYLVPTGTNIDNLSSKDQSDAEQNAKNLIQDKINFTIRPLIRENHHQDRIKCLQEQASCKLRKQATNGILSSIECRISTVHQHIEENT